MRAEVDIMQHLPPEVLPSSPQHCIDPLQAGVCPWEVLDICSLDLHKAGIQAPYTRILLLSRSAGLMVIVLRQQELQKFKAACQMEGFDLDPVKGLQSSSQCYGRS